MKTKVEELQKAFTEASSQNAQLKTAKAELEHEHNLAKQAHGEALTEKEVLKNADKLIQKDVRLQKVMINRPLPVQMQRDLVRGHMACVSWVDQLSGEVLDALDGAGGKTDTIVLLSSDHGFHLGEHGRWSKYTLYEEAVHVPLLLRVPGGKRGVRRTELVELVDVLPTLVAALGGSAAALATALQTLTLSGVLADASFADPDGSTNITVLPMLRTTRPRRAGHARPTARVWRGRRTAPAPTAARACRRRLWRRSWGSSPRWASCPGRTRSRPST